MAVTYTLTLKDKHAVTIFTRASLPEGATTTIWADKYDELATTKVEGSLLRTPMSGPVTLTVTPSAATSDVFDVIVYYENNGAVLTYEVDVTLVQSAAESVTLPISGYFLGITGTAAALISPSISPSASPSISPSASPSLSPSASLSPSISPSVSPSASLSPSISPSLSPSV